MKISILLSAVLSTISLFALASSSTHASPAQSGVATQILLRTTLSGDDSKEVILAKAELAPGSVMGLHTHPGDEYATVLEGLLEIHIAGQEAKRVKAGESYHNARDVVHETRNVGDGPVRIVSTFVIDKGQPVMKPAGS